MNSENKCDILIINGILFDGKGSKPIEADIAIRDSKVIEIGNSLDYQAKTKIDAEKKYISPGFIDLHTHYDVEVEVAPALKESVKHGVTTVIFGNCSLSIALNCEEDLLNLFCRVESLPRTLIQKWLKNKITWKNPKEYYEHLETINIGPNIASFIGHSNLRIDAMGYDRSLTVSKANDSEIAKMQENLKAALDEGYLGMSIDMLPWHRIEAGKYIGFSVPSQQANSSEYRKLAKTLRREGRILQATPNALAKTSVVELFFMTVGMFIRKALKTTIVAAMDIKTNRLLYKLAMFAGFMSNKVFGGNLRWQFLAEPFLNFADGVNTPLFEEFPSGVASISASPAERKKMYSSPEFRSQFRKEWEASGQRMFHRDLSDMFIVKSPEEGLEGMSIAAAAKKAGKEALDFFMDKIAEHDSLFRWKTVITNDRDKPRMEIMAHHSSIPGFNDSGAHNQQMAYHDGGLKFLKQMLNNPEFMPFEKAIEKLTGASAKWLGIDTGTIEVGKTADLIIMDQEKLKTGLGEPVEHFDENFDGNMRLIKKSDGIVTHVIIGGKIAVENSKFNSELGNEKFGRLLRASSK